MAIEDDPIKALTEGRASGGWITDKIWTKHFERLAEAHFNATEPSERRRLAEDIKVELIKWAALRS